jgi:hypothetical protein
MDLMIIVCQDSVNYRSPGQTRTSSLLAFCD